MADALKTTDLSGKLLIAMPDMADPRFDHSVVYMCAHSDDGAMGLIVNKPAPDIAFSDLLEQLGIDTGPDARSIRIHMGGPVENGRGFVLHTSDYSGQDGTLDVDDTFGMTATINILEDISHGRGPSQCILALGYSGWGPGQLENEIQRNGWLTCDATPDLVFGTDNDAKWAAALRSMGIDPAMLSSSGGSA